MSATTALIVLGAIALIAVVIAVVAVVVTVTGAFNTIKDDNDL